jgi:hypothetical protein
VHLLSWNSARLEATRPRDGSVPLVPKNATDSAIIGKIMPAERRVAICYQRRENLSPKQLRFFDAMTAKLRSSGFSLSPDNLGTDRIAERYADLQDCRGVIIPAFSQWEGHRLNRNRTRTWTMPSEFVHIVATMAVAARRPLLVLLERGVDDRGGVNPKNETRS